MESLRRAALICATLVLTTFAAPVRSQQTTPASTQQSVPPAPPPDSRGTAGPTSAAPQHRWVNTGGYLTPEPRQKSSTRKAQKTQSKATSSHSRKAAHAHEDRAAK